MAASEKTLGLLKWVAYTALIAVIGLVCVVFPYLDYVTIVLLPFPVMLLVLQYDLRYGLLGLVSAGLFMCFAVAEPVAAMTLFQYGLLGLALGALFKNKVSSGRILVATIVAAVLLAAGALFILHFLTGVNPLILEPAERQLLVQQWSDMNEQMHFLDGETLVGTDSASEEGSFQYLTDLFQYYLPGQLAVAAAITAILTYVLAVLLLARLGYKIHRGPAFADIFLPWYSIWGLIAGLGLLLLGDMYSEALAKTGRNILFVFANLYLVMGISVFVYYYKTIKIMMLLKLLLLFLMIIYYPVSFILLLLIGATDPLINFRRLPKLK